MATRQGHQLGQTERPRKKKRNLGGFGDPTERPNSKMRWFDRFWNLRPHEEEREFEAKYTKGGKNKYGRGLARHQFMGRQNPKGGFRWVVKKEGEPNQGGKKMKLGNRNEPKHISL